MSIPAAFALMGSNPEEACRFEGIPVPIFHIGSKQVRLDLD